MPVKEIGVVLDRPQRQWAKSKSTKIEEVKYDVFVWIMWDAKFLPMLCALHRC